MLNPVIMAVNTRSKVSIGNVFGLCTVSRASALPAPVAAVSRLNHPCRSEATAGSNQASRRVGDVDMPREARTPCGLRLIHSQITPDKPAQPGRSQVVWVSLRQARQAPKQMTTCQRQDHTWAARATRRKQRPNSIEQQQHPTQTIESAIAGTAISSNIRI